MNISDNKFNPNKNYERLSNGHVFTGKQLNKMCSIANPSMQAVILLDTKETDKPATKPNSDYGI